MRVAFVEDQVLTNQSSIIVSDFKTENMEFKPLLIGCRSYDQVEMTGRIYTDFFWSFTLTLLKITRLFPDVSP